MTVFANRARSRGFSLTELLVAMVVGLLLLAGLVTLMANSKKNYSQQDYNARLQENARFAMDFLSYDIREAGYFGCADDIVNDPAITRVSATEGGSGGAPDSVAITYGAPYDSGNEVFLTTSYEPYDAPLTLTLNRIPGDWSEGTTLLIGDCGSASVADITSGGINQTDSEVTVATDSGGLGRIYDPNSGDGGLITVRRFITNTYSIQTGASGVPVLARNGQELVEGVENIQFLYQGLAGGNFVDGASAPSTLAAVQLGALVRSISNENLDDREFGSGVDITADEGQYTVLNQDVSGVTGTIRGQRRIFSSMLSVRNRPR